MTDTMLFAAIGFIAGAAVIYVSSFWAKEWWTKITSLRFWGGFICGAFLIAGLFGYSARQAQNATCQENLATLETQLQQIKEFRSADSLIVVEVTAKLDSLVQAQAEAAKLGKVMNPKMAAERDSVYTEFVKAKTNSPAPAQ